MGLLPFRIVAPASSAEQAIELFDAGADEVYCGILPEEWGGKYGDADLLSRRQGRASHAGSRAELARLAQAAAHRGRPASLTLNVRYTQGQVPAVLDLARFWEDAGGTGVLACDLGLLLALMDRASGLKRQLSIVAGSFNSLAVWFFVELGVTRVVLPRSLSPCEMRELIRAGPPIEYEVLALNQKCEFIDGLCGFYHGVHLPPGVPAAFERTEGPVGTPPVAWCHDLCYEGHGCRLPYATGMGTVRHIDQDDENAPHCAACALPELASAGVRYLKIAGRGYPMEMLVRGVRFLREAQATTTDPRDLYARTFPQPCDRSRCYY